MKDALKKCREQLGDNVTILYDVNPDSIKKMAKEQGKEAGGPWDCFDGCDFYGWEAEKVVVVTDGVYNIPEMTTRAKRELILIIAEPEKEEDKKYYQEFQVMIKDAADEGLVDLEVIESESLIENTSNTATEDDVIVDVEVIGNENGCVYCCNVM